MIEVATRISFLTLLAAYLMLLHLNFLLIVKTEKTVTNKFTESLYQSRR